MYVAVLLVVMGEASLFRSLLLVGYTLLLMGRISCLCGLRQGATATPPIWNEQ